MLHDSDPQLTLPRLAAITQLAAGAARVLGMHRRTLQHKLAKFPVAR